MVCFGTKILNMEINSQRMPCYRNEYRMKPFSQPNQSLLTGIDCLQWLAASPQPVSNIEMARLLGVDRNRANRLLNSLVMAGMARQTPGRKFTVGSGFHVLAAQSLQASGILHVALPVLAPLNRFDCIVALGVLWKDQVAYLYYRYPGTSADQSIGGRAAPATVSSIGLALLACQKEETINGIYGNREIPHFADLAELHEELALTRDRNYGRHLYMGLKEHLSLAVPIHHRGESIAAIALSDAQPCHPSEAMLEALRDVVAQIEANLA